MSNRRYINSQEAYDFDRNFYHNNLDSSSKNKANNNDNHYNNSETKKLNFNEEVNDNVKEEDIEKMKKQVELIKELMKYKNFQNFVKNILKNRKLGLFDKDGNKIKWSLFKKHLYNIVFLDLYYRHRIPFIIMRPRLDVIRRKREEKLRRQMKEQNQILEKKKKIIIKTI